MKYIMTLTRHDKSIIQKTFENVSIEYFDDMYKLIMETRLYSKITVKLNKNEESQKNYYFNLDIEDDDFMGIKPKYSD